MWNVKYVSQSVFWPQNKLMSVQRGPAAVVNLSVLIHFELVGLLSISSIQLSAFAKLLCQGQIFSAINSVTQQQLFYFFWLYGFWVLFFWQLETLKAFPLNKNWKVNYGQLRSHDLISLTILAFYRREVIMLEYSNNTHWIAELLSGL